MSSSAETPAPVELGWSAFDDRPVPAPVELLSPASELAAALQRCRRDLDAERAAAAEALAGAHAAAAEQAVLVFTLSAALRRHDQALADAGLAVPRRTFRVLRDQMMAALDRGGLTVLDPTGRPFDEVGDLVRVTGWRHGLEYDGEVVAETIEPIVRYGAEVVHPGLVIMGAPDPREGADEGKT
jgi:hypothetical protein